LGDTMSSKHIGALLAGVALASCAHTPANYDFALDLPAPKAASAGPTPVAKVHVQVECAAIAGVAGLPDGWRLAVLPNSEDYIATLEPVGASGSPYQGGTLMLAGRGKYSDCFRVLVTYVFGSTDQAERVTYESQFPRSGWKSL
jgi:glucose/arabinose dehydrogenase